MKTIKRRICSVVLVVSMIVTILPMMNYTKSKAATLVWPVPGHTHLSQGYHDSKAIDINDASIGGASIVAALGGRVTNVFYCSKQHLGSYSKDGCGCNGFGTGVVILGNDNRYYQYAHMQAGSVPSGVRVGANVTAGQVIGKVGNTGNSSGNHLHFGITIGNYWNNSGINPQNETYVYTGASTEANPSISVNTASDKWHVDDYNIVVAAKIYNPNCSYISRVGIQIRDGGNVIASKEEEMDNNYRYEYSANVWYNCISECGVTLKPGHTYTWNIYGTVGGTRVETGWQSIKTTGTEKPNTPTLNTSQKDYAVGDLATVTWGQDQSATGGYLITLTQLTGGSYTKTQETNSYQSVSTSFVLPSAGTYKVTGYGKGSINGDVATLNKTIEAHEPSNVKFVETNEDGEVNVLCEQTVKYGSSAQAPSGISRKGYTFVKWDKDFTKVTSDLVVTAIFKKNVYKVVFYDNLGNILKTESVEYLDAATPPQLPTPEVGYVFGGWSTQEYLSVESNLEVRASYVWENSDLPVVIDLKSCEFKDDGYLVTYDIKNNPDTRTKGRALVSLKTSTGKLLDTTESNAFSLAKGEVKKGLEIYIPYEGKATCASLYIINGFTKGIPISKTANIDVTRTWSDWSTTQPEDNQEIETRTEYRSQDKELTTTSVNNNQSWTLYNTLLDSNWTYGQYSGWSRNSYSAYTNTTNKREVETRTVQDSSAYTLYNWFYYRIPATGTYTYSSSYAASHSGTLYTWQTTYMLNYCKTVNGWNGYTTPGGKNFSNELWYMSGSPQTVAATSHTEWRYRDAVKNYTYYWYRWKDWSDWVSTKIDANDSRKVETRTTYRYRAKMEDIEDNSGTEYTTKGALDKKLAGKQATLLVFKNKESSDSNNEYVGQSVISEDGEYSFTYVTRENISSLTGDYTIMLAVEGSDEPIYIDSIKAPKPKYTVTFKDMNGAVIDTQQVTEHESATAPEVPKVEHYEFVGWNYGLTNINDDIEITAQYNKEKYSVAFVNWKSQDVEVKTFSYEDPISFPDETVIDGYDFVGWTLNDGTQIDNVKENCVLFASYDVKKFNVQFYNKENQVVSKQLIPYQQNAIAPNSEQIDNMEFLGWSTYDFVNVKADVNVYPTYQYLSTTGDPVCDTESGVLTSSIDIHLSAAKDAVIYYTLDGTTPTQLSNVYQDKISITQNSFLQYYAVEPEKNASAVQSRAYLLSASEDDEGALAIKKEKYDLLRGESAKISYFVSHQDKNIGIEFYSLDKDIVSVDSEGTIKANKVGQTKIFVRTSDCKYGDYCDVNVTTNEVDATNIDLNEATIHATKDSTVQLTAKVYPENASSKSVDWYSENEDVAKVSDDGKVDIVGDGVTIIKAMSKTGNCSAECVVESDKVVTSDRFALSSQIMSLKEQESQVINAYYGDGLINCTWNSSNASVASVDSKGTVKANSAGYSIVTATTTDGVAISCVVIVEKVVVNSDNKQQQTTNSTATSTATTVSLPKCTFISLKSNAKRVTLKWKNIKKAYRYQVSYSLNKKANGTKYTSYSNKMITKKLKKGKKYYFRVRAYYGYVNGKSSYGSWSSIKSIKIK